MNALHRLKPHRPELRRPKLHRFKFDRRGSLSVFLVVVFACFITVSAVLFAGAKSVAGRSMADASLQLAGRSVLSEYDKRMFGDYGLIGFRGDESWIEDAIAYYAEASLAPKDPRYALFRSGRSRTVSQDVRCETVEASLAGYSLYDLDNFEDQIRTAALPQTLGALRGNTGNASANSGSAKGGTSRDDGYGRVLRSQSVISSLPSTGYKGPLFPSFGVITDIPEIENVMREGTSLFAVSEYALSVFGNHVDGAKRDRFFGNEIEYLIAGKRNDASNYADIKNRLRAMRFLLNNIALASDPVKMAKVEEIALAAAAISAEILYAPTKVAIMEAWVAAETGNDLMLLERGAKVALTKSPAQWATQNIAEIWAGWTSSEPAYAVDSSGQGYRDYLRLMLYVLDRETKLLRMMDLMQINLKGTYYADFLMREHYMGFRFSCRVNGDEYAYTHKY
ncbi:MAG: DUF5702 domain-containing protein [Clostridiales bacterium]|nr:DUF5702 domain-containing protein [Clostridiales bacterium]